MRESRPGGRQQATSRRTDRGTVDDYETPCPPSKLGLESKTPLETSLAPCSEALPGRTTCWTTLWFWRRGANAAKKPTNAFQYPGVAISNTLATVWIARSQVRPFHEDDEVAHEHVTEHMRKLGEDLSYEDIT